MTPNQVLQALRRANDVARQAIVPVGVAVAGRQEVMVTEHCVLMAEGECSRRCTSCSRRLEGRVLRDRKGYEFPVRTDTSGRSHVYNSVPLDLTAALPEVLELGVSALRVDVGALSAGAAAAEVARVRTALDAAVAGRTLPAPADRSGVTSGHFFRGVS